MQVAVSPNAVRVQLDQELNNIKSHILVSKMLHYLKHKTGLIPFCFSSPGIFDWYVFINSWSLPGE
jgi:hypothetical protein